MPKYLISFPSEAMVLTNEQLVVAAAEAHAVIKEQVDPVLVSGDGSVSMQIYPGSRLTGGFMVLELPTREDAMK